MVHEQIRSHVSDVLPYADFLVLDQKVALSVQPAVPIPSGYAAYWPIQPDSRHVIDITLGVLLSDLHDCEILVGISHRLNLSLLKKLDPTVVKAFEANKLKLQCAKELTSVKPEHQVVHCAGPNRHCISGVATECRDHRRRSKASSCALHP